MVPAYISIKELLDMTMNQLLNLDYREEESKVLIQKYLKKIKPLSKWGCDVPFEKIEKVITILSKKYNMRIREFVPDVWTNDEETVWRAILIDDRNLNQAGIIYGLSLYEVLAKIAIYMYSIREKVGERQVDN